MPANHYSRATALRSNGLTDDMQLQGNRIAQPRRPGNGEFNRYSPGQGVGGLEQNTAARYIYCPANPGYHLTIAEDYPVFECCFDRVAVL